MRAQIDPLILAGDRMLQDWVTLTELLIKFVNEFMTEMSGRPQQLTPVEMGGMHHACLKALENIAQAVLAKRAEQDSKRTFDGMTVEVAEMLDFEGAAWRFRIAGTAKWDMQRFASKDAAFDAARELIVGGSLYEYHRKSA